MTQTIEHMKLRLASQMSRGEPVLFLGAGFSLGATNHAGAQIPGTQELAEDLWRLAFPDDEFDPTTTLGDIYHCALTRGKEPLTYLLQDRLSVDSDTLPDFYRIWFTMPWHRCYTLNIDDLETAVTRRYQLPRALETISAIDGESTGHQPDNLEVVHLNGSLSDPVDRLTFSEADYGERLASPDAWLARCSADILSRPVVYAGTEIHEPTLWQYVAYRSQKGGRGVNELRPGSYLVTPTLSKPREVLLKELNVDWIPLSAQQFAESWLTELKSEADAGHKAIFAASYEADRRKTPALVSELAAEQPAQRTEYLQGQHPTWSDLQTGRAIARECDEEIYQAARSSLEGASTSLPLLISGTAGSGKSTALMRLGLRLTSDGVPVYWIDEASNVEPFRLRQAVMQAERPVAVLVDDADLWGRYLTGWAIELPKCRPGVLFGASLRSTRIDGVMDPGTLGGIEPVEFSMPKLTDSDIDGLIEVLDKDNRLGVLKGMSIPDRVAAFREHAGRQLLVAMIQATSGVQFSRKVYDEFRELQGQQRFLYGVVCLVSSQRYTIDREELLLASGNSDNQTLNALETLVRRHLVTRKSLHADYGARHRVIAEELVHGMEFRQWLGQMLQGITFAFANTVDPTMRRSDRRWRRLIRFIKHDYLMRVLPIEAARTVYENVESLLNWDYHYWLQRGSLEVEAGDLSLATNFLNQARSLAGDDRFVENEYAYLQMKKAASVPHAPDAPNMFNDGYSTLEALIRAHGRDDRHPFHVLGSQTIAWVRQASMPALDKARLLRSTLEQVKAGVRLHPRSDELRILAHDLEREWLMTAVPEQSQ